MGHDSETPCQRTGRGYGGGAQGARVELLAFGNHLMLIQPAVLLRQDQYARD